MARGSTLADVAELSTCTRYGEQWLRELERDPRFEVDPVERLVRLRKEPLNGATA